MSIGWIVLKITLSLVLLFSLVTASLCCFSFRFKNIVFGRVEWVGYLQIVFLLLSAMAVLTYGFDDTLILVPQSWRIIGNDGEPMRYREYLAGSIGGLFAIACVAILVRIDNEWSKRIKFETEAKALRIIAENSILRQERRQFLLNKHTKVIESGLEREEQLASSEREHLEFEIPRRICEHLKGAGPGHAATADAWISRIFCEILSFEFRHHVFAILAYRRTEDLPPVSLNDWEIVEKSGHPLEIRMSGFAESGEKMIVTYSERDAFPVKQIGPSLQS